MADSQDPSRGDRDVRIHDQTQFNLPRSEKIKIFCLLCFNQCISFMDQNAMSVLLLIIAKEFRAEGSISWASTSSLVGNAVFHLLSGRLSDLFGRRTVLVASLVALSLSCVGVGCAQNAPMLYVFRAVAGMANGGTSSMTSNVISDVWRIEERGKYQGMLGIMVGLGTMLGPLLGSAFVLRSENWRGLFYLLSGLSLVAAGLSWKMVPCNMPKQDFNETLKKIDYLGIVTSAAAEALLVVALTQAGHPDSPWDGPMIITFLVLSAVLFCMCICNELWWAKLPIIPLSMFRNPSIAAMMGQTLFFGWVFYSQVFLLPLYFQRVHGESPLMSTVFTLPMTLSQALFAGMSGLLLYATKRYWQIMFWGFMLWTLGAGLLLADSMILHIVALAILGAGVGMTFNTNITPMQAHVAEDQRAVVNSCRNFIRSSGGAIGLAVSSAVMRAAMQKMPPDLPSAVKDSFAAVDLTAYPEDERKTIADVFAEASHKGFVWCLPWIGLCLVACFVVKNTRIDIANETRGVQPEGPEATPKTSRSESMVESHRMQDLGHSSSEVQGPRATTETSCG